MVGSCGHSSVRSQPGRTSRKPRCSTRSSAQFRRGLLLTAGLFVSPLAQAADGEFASSAALAMGNRQGSFKLSDDEWKTRLSPTQYSILRQASTERPFVSPLNNEKRKGMCRSSVCICASRHDPTGPVVTTCVLLQAHLFVLAVDKPFSHLKPSIILAQGGLHSTNHFPTL